MLITSLFVERVGVSYLLLIKQVKLFPHEIKNILFAGVLNKQRRTQFKLNESVYQHDYLLLFESNKEKKSQTLYLDKDVKKKQED